MLASAYSRRGDGWLTCSAERGVMLSDHVFIRWNTKVRNTYSDNAVYRENYGRSLATTEQRNSNEGGCQSLAAADWKCIICWRWWCINHVHARSRSARLKLIEIENVGDGCASARWCIIYAKQLYIYMYIMGGKWTWEIHKLVSNIYYLLCSMKYYYYYVCCQVPDTCIWHLNTHECQMYQ